jgi:hypothetical protein
MNYTITSNYYKNDKWDVIWLDSNEISIPPKSSSQVTATIVTPLDYQSGVYQGFVIFEGKNHTVNVPVSFGVKKLIDKKDTNILNPASQDTDIMYGNGYVKGAFDMVNRYMAGDWRQYYFDIADKTINTGSIDISWQNDDTNLSVFVFDPQGRMVQTNVPSGVFGHFMGWPSVDWLGTTAFSQGGGFFPVKNKDFTSTVLNVPINQTGTYTLLIHSTLFGGNSTTEPVSVAAKFTTILHDDKPPQINIAAPEFISDLTKLSPEIIDDNLSSVEYYLDGRKFNFTSDVLENLVLSDGKHQLKITAVDILGYNTTKEFTLNIDTKNPVIVIKSPKNGTSVSNTIEINFDVTDEHLPEKDAFRVELPTGEVFYDTNSISFDTKQLDSGLYDIKINAKDKAGNVAQKSLFINVDHVVPPPIRIVQDGTSQNHLLIIGIVIGIAIGIVSVLLATKKIKISSTH